MKTIRIDRQQRKTSPKGRGAYTSSALAFFCLSAGAIAPILGLIFIIIHATLVSDRLFGEVGTGMMIVSIPLLLAGSHFLDVWDQYRRKSEYPDRDK